MVTVEKNELAIVKYKDINISGEPLYCNHTVSYATKENYELITIEIQFMKPVDEEKYNALRKEGFSEEDLEEGIEEEVD